MSDEPTNEPCPNCEVLRNENRALQAVLERTRKAHDAAAARLRVQGALEAAQQAYQAASAQLQVVQEELAQQTGAGDTPSP